MGFTSKWHSYFCLELFNDYHKKVFTSIIKSQSPSISPVIITKFITIPVSLAKNNKSKNQNQFGKKEKKKISSLGTCTHH